MFNTRIPSPNRTVFKLLILTLLANFSVAGIQIAPVLAENRDREIAANNETGALEQEVLAEINRARTNPQGYADWLEEQKQYYNGVFLTLPGEKPLRSNRVLKAIQEAIDFLKAQQPLSPLDASEELADSATKQLDNLEANSVDQNISYGRVTAKGIVMNLVVDDRFPDRRHRLNLFTPDLDIAGVICQPDARYQNICAIAYEEDGNLEIATENDSEAEAEQEAETENTTAEETETLPTPPEVAVNSESPDANSESDRDAELEVSEEDNSDEGGDDEEEYEDEDDEEELEDEEYEDDESEEEELEDEDEEDEELEVSENNDDEDEEDGDDDEEELDEDEEDEDGDNEEELEEDEGEEEDNNEDEDDEDEDGEEADEDRDEDTVATNSSNSSLIERIKRGSLEDGDNIIPDDGSFYDSYPLEGKAGDSFIISLESEEFDTFVAVMDAEGNIVDQNDDINDNNSNSRLRITLPSDGAYNIIVNAYDEGGTGRYTLTVRR